jgi:hypothetical protein
VTGLSDDRRTPTPPADIPRQAELKRLLQRAGVGHVIGITAPAGGQHEWVLYLNGGGDNVEARAALARIPGVADVRRSRLTGSIVTFTLDREAFQP